MRILLIDDDDALRRMLRRMLEQAGYDVEEARNGKVALDAYRRQPADLVITDLVMPEKEGLETIAELRRLYPGVRLIAMTGGVGSGDAGLYLKAAGYMGAHKTLAKPFSRDELLMAVMDALSTPESDVSTDDRKRRSRE